MREEHMRLLDVFKSLSPKPKRVIGRRFAVGNPVYFVDRIGIPHIGVVFGVYSGNQTLEVGNLVPEKYKDQVMTVEMCRCTVTSEIAVECVRDRSEFRKSRNCGDYSYESMPKKTIYEKEQSKFTPLIVFKEGYYIKLFNDDNLYMLKSQSSCNNEPYYYLEDLYGRKLGNISLNVKNVFSNGYHRTGDTKIIEALDGIKPITEDDISEVWLPDDYASDFHLYNTYHMSLLYKNRNMR